MLYLRYLIRPLVIVALGATALSLAAGSVSAQDIKVFKFTNAEAEGSDWEVRASVESFGGCGVSEGRGGGTSGWLERGDEWGIVLNLNCSYTFSGTARNEETKQGELCDVALAWGTSADYDGATMLATRAPGRSDQTDVAIVHRTGDGLATGNAVSCAAAITARFSLDPASVVEDLPKSATDSELEKRAERAVEATKFRVNFRPHEDTKNMRGCNQVLVFDVSGGEDGEVDKPLPGIPSGANCRFRATIASAPAPFNIANANGTIVRTNEAESGVLSVDLSSLVRLPWGRIAIVQDVTGSNNQGHVSYRVDRSCAGVGGLPPNIRTGGGPGIYSLPGGQVVATLTVGRFTVHSNNFANFGAGANYLAVARSTISTAVDGCSVSVSVIDSPATCTVAPSRTQTLEWRSGAPFDHFDFEFDFVCGGSSSTTDDDGLPPQPPEDPMGTDDRVRIVARKLANGKIEFGLQQRRDADTWAARRLPSARLFPSDAGVDRWLASSPLTLSVAPSSDSFAADVQVRVVARKRANGKIEFGLQQQDDGGSWGDRQFPRARMFPTTARTGSWLNSSVITLLGG